jgi:spermidine synthase
VVSGASALVYQVAWQRLLALSSGVAVYSVAAITAAFMAGLCAGSYLGGIWSRHLSQKQAARAFAVLEFGLALFALISVPLYYDVLYRQMGWLYETPAGSFGAHFLSLLVPTTLMGMSLPLLVRGLALASTEAPRMIGILYAANTLGAAAGAFLTPWVLLRFLGVDGAVLVGAFGSALAAVGAWYVSVAIREVGGEAAAPAEQPEGGPIDSAWRAATGETAAPFAWWATLYAISGFVSLSLEIVWFRVLDVVAKGAAFTFGTLLGIYLLGLASGAFAGSVHARRIRRPLRAFVACQGLMLAVTLLAHLLLVRLPPTFPVISWIIHYGTGDVGVRMEPFSFGAFGVMYLALPMALFGPATFLMGFGFPILQRAVHRGAQASGRTVGFLQAANIAGCTLGSLVTGLILLDAVGTSGTFRFLAAVGALVTAAGAWMARERRLYGLAGGLVVLAVLFPQNDELWLRLIGNAERATSFVEEDAASVTAFTRRDPSTLTLWINGRTNSWVPFGSVHTVLGALPSVVHKAPRDVAIIGLGSGDTAWAAGVREETQAVTVFEIATSQPRLLARVQELPHLADLRSFLADPRVKIVKDDGRRRLGRDGLKYDVIEADAIHPDSGLSGYLYSVEFYELVARSLKPGGVMCAWAPTARARNGALQVFPHAIDFGGLLLLSNEEIPIESQVWRDRLSSPRFSAYFGEARLSQIASFVTQGVKLPPGVPGGDVNRDLQPKDEYLRPEVH